MDNLSHMSMSARDILAQLTLSEKLSFLSGQSVWTLADLPPRLFQGHDDATITPLPTFRCSDGPHGVRKQVKETALHSFPATCFPTASALACSWDEHLVETMGNALARECEVYQVQLLLGPGLNLKRHPAGGRNFEYFSEDPLLSGRMAAAYIRGVQSTRITTDSKPSSLQNRGAVVGACAKHFCINNQETCRFVVNAMVDERTARELYYRGFEYIVKQSDCPPVAIMCAYNAVNGVFCSENYFLNTELLRDEWGFQGVVLTDWGATNRRVAGIQAGVDLEMPGSHGIHHRDIHRALREGRLSLRDIDTSVEHVLQLILSHQPTQHSEEEQPPNDDWMRAHGQLARQIARDCVVLLQNHSNLLPLSKGTNVSLIGAFAKDHPRFQGMGSSQVNATHILNAFDEMKAFTNQVHYAPGYAVDGPFHVIDNALLEEAVRVARKGDVVVLVRTVDPCEASASFP